MEINVQAYGAVGDGVTDDTAAIQSAFNAASNGDEFYLPPPPAFYLTSSPLITTLASFGMHGGGLASTIIVNSSGGDVIDATGMGSGTANIRDISFGGGANSMQTYLNLNGYSKLFLNNITASGNYRFLNTDGANFIMMSQIQADMAGGSEAIRIHQGGGCISNCYIRKARTIGNVGPTVWMTGQVTSLNVSNCGFSGIGTPFKSVLSSVVNNGSTFTCTMNGLTPHNFGVAGEIAVITGTGTAYDGQWVIASVLSNMQFTVNAITGLGNFSGSAACYKPESTLYMSNAGSGAVNETNWCNVTFESIDAKSVGSYTLYLDTIPGPWAVANHNFTGCLGESGESFMALMGKGYTGQFINNINWLGGNIRYSRNLVYQIAAGNFNIRPTIYQTPSTPMGYIS